LLQKGGILRLIGKFVATKGENLWGQWGYIQQNNSRGYCFKREQMLRQMGKIAATNREGGATDWENAQKGRGDVGLSGVENEGKKSKLRQIWEKIRG